MTRPVRFNMLLSVEERTMLASLAADDGLSASDWLRVALRNEYRRRCGRGAVIKVQPGISDGDREAAAYGRGKR